MEARAYANLSICLIHMHKFEEALSFIKSQQALALDMEVKHMKTDADMNMGIALAFKVSLLLAAPGALRESKAEVSGAMRRCGRA